MCLWTPAAVYCFLLSYSGCKKIQTDRSLFVPTQQPGRLMLEPSVHSLCWFMNEYIRFWDNFCFNRFILQSWWQLGSVKIISVNLFLKNIYIFPARQVQPPSLTQPLSGITRFSCSDRWSKAVTAMRTTTVRHHPYLTSQLACCQKKPAVARDELIVNRFLLAVKAMCFSDTRNYSWALKLTGCWWRWAGRLWCQRGAIGNVSVLRSCFTEKYCQRRESKKELNLQPLIKYYVL